MNYLTNKLIEVGGWAIFPREGLPTAVWAIDLEDRSAPEYTRNKFLIRMEPDGSCLFEFKTFVPQEIEDEVKRLIVKARRRMLLK